MTDTLQIQHVTKQFGGLTAVDKVDIDVRRELHFQHHRSEWSG